jgi:hypothetical protein
MNLNIVNRNKISKNKSLNVKPLDLIKASSFESKTPRNLDINETIKKNDIALQI